MRVYKKTIYLLSLLIIISIILLFFINYRINIGSIFLITQRNVSVLLSIIENITYGIFTGAFISLFISIVGYLTEKQKLYIEIYIALQSTYTNFLIIYNIIQDNIRTPYTLPEQDIKYFGEVYHKYHIFLEDRNKYAITDAINNFNYNIDSLLNFPLLIKYTKSKGFSMVLQAGNINTYIRHYNVMASDISSFYNEYIESFKLRDEQNKLLYSQELYKIINKSKQEIPHILALIDFIMREILKYHKADFKWKQIKENILTEQLCPYYQNIINAEKQLSDSQT